MEIVSYFNDIINTNIFIACIISFVGGLISSFSPCTLSTLPLIIGYVVGEDKKSKALKYSIFFSLGIILTFVLIGIVSNYLGMNLKVYSKFWYIFLAGILIITSLYLLKVFQTKKEISCKRPKLSRNSIGAFFLGIIGGIFDSPCSTPILVIILTFVSQTNNIFFAALLMLFYSIGHVMVIIIAGSSLNLMNKLLQSDKYIKIGNIMRIVFGILSLVLAMYLIYVSI